MYAGCDLQTYTLQFQFVTFVVLHCFCAKRILHRNFDVALISRRIFMFFFVLGVQVKDLLRSVED